MPNTASRAASTLRSSHSILVPEKYGSITSPVRSRTSSSWPASRSSSQRAAVRRSCQTSALWTGSPVSGSQATTVSRWLVIPIASRLRRIGRRRRAPAAATRLGHLPDLVRVVLDPARPREVLGELAVGAAARSARRGRRRGRWCRSFPGRSRGSRPGEPIRRCRRAATGTPRAKSRAGGPGARSRPASGRSPGARGRARPRRPGSRRGRASTVIPISIPKPSANGSTARRTSARIARWPEIGAVARKPQRRSIAQRAKPSASPNPPPTRRENAATARSHSPVSTASTSRVRAPADAAEVAVAQQRAAVDRGRRRRAPRRPRR